jgi:hypothetical protein
MNECRDTRHRNDQAANRIQHGENLEFALALEVGREAQLPRQINDQADINEQWQVVDQEASEFTVHGESVRAVA